MTHGSLFSGIGGFDLAARWMGWRNVFHVERDPFCQRVLNHHFPESQGYDDITRFDATDFRGRISVLSGGWPCQPWSNAGLRKGTMDDRHLWPEMLRVIRECAPRYVVGENVLGLTTWESGVQFDTVLADLETCGYTVQPFVLPACGVNAPHRRDRVFVVATADPDLIGEGQTPGGDGGEAGEVRGNPEGDIPVARSGGGTTADTTGAGARQDNGQGESGQPDETRPNHYWEDFPTQSPVCGGDDGLPTELDGITVSNWKRQSLKAYGNAVVPQLAHTLFQTIQQIENDTRRSLCANR